MANTTDARRILDLLAQGKITVEEADQLLRAVAAGESKDAPAVDPPPQGTAAESADKPAPKWLRLTVDKAADDGRPRRQVNIRVPLALLRGGMKLGAVVPRMAPDLVIRRLREKGIEISELSKLDFSEFENMLTELGDTTIDVDDGRAQLRFSKE
jgi:hypothetical protein